MSLSSKISISFIVNNGAIRLYNSSVNNSLDERISKSAGIQMKQIVDNLNSSEQTIQLTEGTCIEGSLTRISDGYEMLLSILNQEPMLITLNEDFVKNLSGIPRTKAKAPITPPLSKNSNLDLADWVLLPSTKPMVVYPITNTGTDCFMNAILQVIMHDDLLRDAVQQTYQKLDTPKAKALLKAMEDYSKGIIISTSDLRQFMPLNFQKDQQDASEFMQQLLNEVSSKDHPDLFCCLKTTYVWEKNGWFGSETKTTFETLNEFMIPLQIPSQPKILSGKELIKSHFEKKKHVGESFKDEETGKVYTPGQVQLQVEGAPKRLNFLLKRFDNHKIHTPVDMPEKIEINRTTYALKKVVVHHGATMGSGHYTCQLQDENGIWTSANDMTISQVKDPSQDLQNGYIYFYEKLN